MQSVAQVELFSEEGVRYGVERCPPGAAFEKTGSSRWVVAGPTSSGKTYFVVHALRAGWFGKFDDATLLTSTPDQGVYRLYPWSAVEKFDAERLEAIVFKGEEGEPQGVQRGGPRPRA